MIKVDVTTKYQVEAEDIDDAIDKIADITRHIPDPKAIDFQELGKVESGALIEGCNDTFK